MRATAAEDEIRFLRTRLSRIFSELFASSGALIKARLFSGFGDF